jgi:hypothetical protein
LALYQAATAALTAKTQRGPEGRNQQMINNAWPRWAISGQLSALAKGVSF